MMLPPRLQQATWSPFQYPETSVPLFTTTDPPPAGARQLSQLQGQTIQPQPTGWKQPIPPSIQLLLL